MKVVKFIAGNCTGNYTKNFDDVFKSFNSRRLMHRDKMVFIQSSFEL